MEQLEKLKKEYDEILQQLSDPELIYNWEKMEKLNKRRAFLEKLINKEEELKEVKDKIGENKSIISANEEEELVSLAETELSQLKEKEEALEKEINQLLTSGEQGEENRAVIMEIRAGTGGEEAALFAADLFRMYSKYAEEQGWKQKILDSKPTEIEGFKEITFELKDTDILSKMKTEAGVHRVQRIPTTEKSGRIHTSTASVAVLPKPKKQSVKINPQELKTDVYRASGPGGQYVNRRETAVRITHLPTGLVAASQNERSQRQNRENAMAILEAKLHKLKESQAQQNREEERRSQIKGAERSDKIRTYNFPQDRVTDHRIKKSFHNIETIMAGKLGQIIEALQNQETT